jgi:hypothetical protein
VIVTGKTFPKLTKARRRESAGLFYVEGKSEALVFPSLYRKRGGSLKFYRIADTRRMSGESRKMINPKGLPAVRGKYELPLDSKAASEFNKLSC